MARRHDPLPATFEARGAVIPFAGKSVMGCRLRVVATGRTPDREIVVPSGRASAEISTMIMPWSSLPVFATLSARDRALYDAIDRLDAEQGIDPFAIRATTQRVDQEHGLDDAIRTRARRDIERERRDRLTVYLSFVAAIMRVAGTRLDDPFMAGATAGLLERITRDPGHAASVGVDAEGLTDRAFRFATEALGAAHGTVNARLEELVDFLAPFGPLDIDPQASGSGFLARRRDDLVRMDRQLAAFGEESRVEIHNIILLIRFAIRDFSDYLKARFRRMELHFEDLLAALGAYEPTKALCLSMRRDVSFALDGWGELCDLWFTAHESGDEAATEAALWQILDFLPVMPADEMERGDDRRRVWHGFGGARAEMVRMLVGWGTNVVDEELVDRIRKARARGTGRD